MFVAWNMGEWREFARLKHFLLPYRATLLGTFVLTVVFDLTVAVELGLVLAVVLFVRRQSDIFRVDACPVQAPTAPPAAPTEYRLYGTLFFGAVTKLDPLLERAESAAAGTTLTLDLSRMLSLDTTGLDALEQLQRTLARRGAHLRLRFVQPQPLSLMQRSGFWDRVVVDGGPPDGAPPPL
jgi:SulP family sulfate permease